MTENTSLKLPKPYLDTNVILDYIRRRKVESISLLDTILKRKIKCYTSYYTIYELIDRGQEDKWIWKRIQEGETFDDIIGHRYPRKLESDELRAVFKQLEKKFLLPFVKTDIVEVVIPNSDSWDKILELLQKHNFSVGDAFHVDTAIGRGCNIFITRDDKLETMLNELGLIPVASPMNLKQRLAELRIAPIANP